LEHLSRFTLNATSIPPVFRGYQNVRMTFGHVRHLGFDIFRFLTIKHLTSPHKRYPTFFPHSLQKEKTTSKFFSSTIKAHFAKQRGTKQSIEVFVTLSFSVERHDIREKVSCVAGVNRED
jgi:hypothetical protein